MAEHYAPRAAPRPAHLASRGSSSPHRRLGPQAAAPTWLLTRPVMQPLETPEAALILSHCLPSHCAGRRPCSPTQNQSTAGWPGPLLLSSQRTREQKRRKRATAQTPGAGRSRQSARADHVTGSRPLSESSRPVPERRLFSACLLGIPSTDNLQKTKTSPPPPGVSLGKKREM